MYEAEIGSRTSPCVKQKYPKGFRKIPRRMGFCVMFVSDSIKIVGRAIGPSQNDKEEKEEGERKEISFRTFDLVFYVIV